MEWLQLYICHRRMTLNFKPKSKHFSNFTSFTHSYADSISSASTTPNNVDQPEIESFDNIDMKKSSYQSTIPINGDVVADDPVPGVQSADPSVLEDNFKYCDVSYYGCIC